MTLFGRDPKKVEVKNISFHGFSLPHSVARSAGAPDRQWALWGQNVPKFVGQRAVLACNQTPFQSL